ELAHIQFAARLVTDRHEEVELNQALLVITEELLRQYLTEAQFSEIEVAANFSGAVFERHSSPMLVMSARSHLA
ncbi:MAG: hypothetical protein EA428_13200, partial [Spirochaetaceae bacterium]